jgi:hypothetical protein
MFKGLVDSFDRGNWSFHKGDWGSIQRDFMGNLWWTKWLRSRIRFLLTPAIHQPTTDPHPLVTCDGTHQGSHYHAQSTSGVCRDSYWIRTGRPGERIPVGGRGKHFCTCPHQAWYPVQWVPGLFPRGGYSRQGVALTNQPIYLYSPSGPVRGRIRKSKFNFSSMTRNHAGRTLTGLETHKKVRSSVLKMQDTKIHYFIVCEFTNLTEADQKIYIRSLIIWLTVYRIEKRHFCTLTLTWTHTHTNTLTLSHTHTHTHTDTDTQTLTLKLTHTLTLTHIHTETQTHTLIHTHHIDTNTSTMTLTQTHTHTDTHSNSHTHTQTDTHSLKNTLTHTHTHSHTDTQTHTDSHTP